MTAKRKEILMLNDLYHNYLYISSLKTIEEEKKRLNNIFHSPSINQ
jgi:hypothetical protein